MQTRPKREPRQEFPSPQGNGKYPATEGWPNLPPELHATQRKLYAQSEHHIGTNQRKAATHGGHPTDWLGATGTCAQRSRGPRLWPDTPVWDLPAWVQQPSDWLQLPVLPLWQADCTLPSPMSVRPVPSLSDSASSDLAPLGLTLPVMASVVRASLGSHCLRWGWMASEVHHLGRLEVHQVVCQLQWGPQPEIFAADVPLTETGPSLHHRGKLSRQVSSMGRRGCVSRRQGCNHSWWASSPLRRMRHPALRPRLSIQGLLLH